MAEATSLNKHFEPLVRDVLALKNLLLKRFNFPQKITDKVVDFAEYWPHTSTIRTGGAISIRGGNTGAEPKAPDGSRISENQFVLRTYPLGHLPDEGNLTTCSMTNIDSFPTTVPSPWIVPETSSSMNKELAAQITNNNQIRGEFPCRKIVFTIKSHDQGWGGERAQKGTYAGSYTWFDVGQERSIAFKETLYTSPSQESGAMHERVADSAEEKIWYSVSDLSPLPRIESSSGGDGELESKEPSNMCTLYTISPEVKTGTATHEPLKTDTWFSHALLPGDKCLQKNLTATRKTQENIITWRYDDAMNPESLDAKMLFENEGRGPASRTGDYVRGLRIGDTVTLWAKARFPGWVNTVEEVGIDVYWAV